MKQILITILTLLILASCKSTAQDSDSIPPEDLPKAVPSARSVEIVRRSTGVFIYKYKESIDPINPQNDYIEEKRIPDAVTIQRIKDLLLANESYSPQYRVRCLPNWDYGIEFRESKTQSRFFLFSTRCNQLKLHEDKIFRDYSPQRESFHEIFTKLLGEIK